MDYSIIPLQDTEALIKWLNDIFPERCPNPKDTTAEMWMKAGERRAVNLLISRIENTEKTLLEGE